jgi:hypothetical protein
MWTCQNGMIYYKSGEKYYGPVYTSGELYFDGNPEFFGECRSAALIFGGSTNDVIFHKGLELGVPVESLAGVTFSNLLPEATLSLTGRTYLTFSGTNILITNTKMAWTNHIYNLIQPIVIAVGNPTGDVYVGGQLDGRVTVIAERDIDITNHLRYAVDPAIDKTSTDALGLIAGRDVVVTTSCPYNETIYAHIMATGNLTPVDDTDGIFGVENYDTGNPRGVLNFYGGLVQNVRGAVGTYNPSDGTNGQC